MVRVRIISFDHPRNWNGTQQTTNGFMKITSASKSWVNRNGVKGFRYGVYKGPELVNSNSFVSLPLVWEKVMASSSSKIEELLDNVITNNENNIATFTGSLIIDLNEGLGYLVERGFILMPVPRITELLENLSEDTGVSLNNFRMFAWDKDKIRQFRDVAVQNNFTPNRETGKVGLVRIDAKGDIEHEQKWVNAESMLNDGSWTKSSYENLDQQNRFGFALVRKGNYVSFQGVGNDDLSLLMSRISLVKGLFEQTLGKTIPEYCFSDHV
jgi:hypothetical protein